MSEIVVTSTTVSRPTLGAATSVETETRPGTPLANLSPIQIAGLVPMYDCDEDECRINPIDGCCDKLLVFAGEVYTANVGTYENDVNSFIQDVALYTANVADTSVSWLLQKCSGSDTWINTASLNNTTYGYFWNLGANTSNPTYSAIRVNWGKVYAAFGRGVYRIRFSCATRTLEGCALSPEFDLKPFDCGDAHGTVKFETYSTGQVGAIGRPGKAVSLCGFSFILGDPKTTTGWYDSIRLPGFFGYEMKSEYLEVFNEWQNGRMEQVKNEAIQSYTYKGYPVEKAYHDRLSVNGMMAEVLQVSDYNINNSDYHIRQMSIVLNGGYEPKYNDKLWFNKQSVECKFKNGYQSLIKSICCPSIR